MTTMPSGPGTITAEDFCYTNAVYTIPQAPSSTASSTDVSGGHGDPHIVNIRGEKFDIWRLGTVELLRLHDKDSHHPEFRFTANVSSEHETQSVSLCDARYMTSMRFSGSWFGNQEVYIRLVDGEMRVHVGDKSLIPLEQVLIGKKLSVSRPSESLVTVSVGDATINVMPDNAVFKPQHGSTKLGQLGIKDRRHPWQRRPHRSCSEASKLRKPIRSCASQSLRLQRFCNSVRLGRMYYSLTYARLCMCSYAPSRKLECF